jgi:hypothetical protein
MSQSTSSGPAISMKTQSVCLFNTVIGNGGLIGIALNSTTVSGLIVGNTVVGFVDGINILTGNGQLQRISYNMLTENSSYSINCVDAGAAAWIYYNRMRDVATVNNGTNWAAMSVGNVTTDTGGSETDYVDYASQDLRLISSSPAANASLPYAASMGALQLPSSSSSIVNTVFKFQRSLPDIRTW